MRKINLIIGLLVLFIANTSFGQRAREIQLDNPPPDWQNPWVLATCLIIPVLLIISWFVLRNFTQKKAI